MAKEKKNLEQLLKKALVPVEEQPYEVPENWVWTRLGNIVEINPTRIKPKLDNDSICSFIPMRAVSDEYGIATEIEEEKFGKLKKGYTYFEENDILFAKITPCMENGKIAIAKGLKNGFGFGSTEFHVIKCDNFALQEYIYLFIRQESFRSEAIDHMTGSVGQKRVPKQYLKNHIFSLPPLNEQKRIVEKLEGMLSKLKEAKQLIQGAKETFKLRRASILHKAFTGELTKKWREENNLEFKWESLPLKEVADLRAGYAFDSGKFSNSGYQVIRMGNLYNGVLDLSRNPVFIKESDIDENVLKRSKIKKGDILLTLTGTKYKRDYGHAVLISNEMNLLLNQRIMSLSAISVETKYLLYYLKTNLFRDIFFSNETGGVNQGNVSSKFVETIEIPIPSLVEQKEIVRILDEIFIKENSIDELIQLEDQIDLIEKSILSKAFRGELGTTDPSDEPALELLKRVLETRANRQ